MSLLDVLDPDAHPIPAPTLDAVTVDTVAGLLDALAQGRSVRIRPGTYRLDSAAVPGGVWLRKGGTRSQPLVVMADDPADWPVLDFGLSGPAHQEAATNDTVFNVHASWVVLWNLHIRHASYGVRIWQPHVTVFECEIGPVGWDGIKLHPFAACKWAVVGCRIRDCGSLWPPEPSRRHGIYGSRDGRGLVVFGNDISHCTGAGIRLKCEEELAEMEPYDPDRAEWSHGRRHPGTYEARVEQNCILNCGEGINFAFLIWNSRVAHNTYVWDMSEDDARRHNIVRHSVKAFDLRGHAGNTFENNLVVLHRPGGMALKAHVGYRTRQTLPSNRENTWRGNVWAVAHPAALSVDLLGIGDDTDRPFDAARWPWSDVDTLVTPAALGITSAELAGCEAVRALGARLDAGAQPIREAERPAGDPPASPDADGQSDEMRRPAAPPRTVAYLLTPDPDDERAFRLPVHLDGADIHDGFWTADARTLVRSEADEIIGQTRLAADADGPSVGGSFRAWAAQDARCRVDHDVDALALTLIGHGLPEQPAGAPAADPEVRPTPEVPADSDAPAGWAEVVEEVRANRLRLEALAEAVAAIAEKLDRLLDERG